MTQLLFHDLRSKGVSSISRITIVQLWPNFFITIWYSENLISFLLIYVYLVCSISKLKSLKLTRSTFQSRIYFCEKLCVPQIRQRLVLVLRAEAPSFFVRYTIEKLVTLHCASSKNWNGNPNAVRDSTRGGRVSRARVYSMDVPLSKRRSIKICVDCSRLTLRVPIKLSLQITFTFMIGKFYKAYHVMEIAADYARSLR